MKLLKINWLAWLRRQSPLEILREQLYVAERNRIEATHLREEWEAFEKAQRSRIIRLKAEIAKMEGERA